MCIVAAPGQRELDPLTLEGAARSGGSAGPPSSASHVVPTAGQSAFLPGSSGHRVRFQEAQMQPGLRPSPGSHPPTRWPQSRAAISHGSHRDPPSFKEVGDWTPALNRKVNKELAVIFNSPQVAQAGRGSPPVGGTDESEGPPKAQEAPWTLGFRFTVLASWWPRTRFPLPPTHVTTYLSGSVEQPVHVGIPG